VVEVRRLEPSMSLPTDSDWALVESSRRSRRQKKALARSLAPAFGPAVFENLEGAFAATKAWAAKDKSWSFTSEKRGRRASELRIQSPLDNAGL
jgi:hypothetical protein